MALTTYEQLMVHVYLTHFAKTWPTRYPLLREYVQSSCGATIVATVMVECKAARHDDDAKSLEN